MPYGPAELKYTLILIAVAISLSAAGAAGRTAGYLVNPASVPDDWQLPENVIDTTELPRFSLQRDAGDDSPLPVYRLAQNTFFLFGSIATLNDENRGWTGNAGFVVTAEGVVVIDALGTPALGRRLIATIRSITDKPVRYLVITHNHPDHSYGATAFQALNGVTVIGHPGMAEYNRSATMEESVAYRRAVLTRDMQGFAAPQSDVYVDKPEFGKTVFELGGERFEIYNTGRHHSHGDLVVYQPGQGIVWISDLAFNQRTTFMGNGDSRQILEAQDWLMRAFPDAVLMVPGHGGPQTAPFPMVEKTRDYVERLRHDMQQAVAQGVSLYDAVQGSHFKDWAQTRLYEENHRANANFVYREMEQDYFENF